MDNNNNGILTINIVYAHFPHKDVYAVRRGALSILWSTLPIEGCNLYAYHDAFSYKGKREGLNVLMMLEPAVVLPGEYDERVWKHFDRIFTLCDSLVAQGGKFHKMTFPRADGPTAAAITEDPAKREALYPLAGRKRAICMISGHKSSSVPGELYSKRYEAAEWFSKNATMPFDVYGRPAFPLKNYLGEIPDGKKLSALSRYRYSLCFENTNHPALSAGYITEKILDCFEARTIPIYWGASNIEQYIPKECFIDFRAFAGFRELDRYVREMSQKEYEQYVHAIDAWVTAGNLRKYSWLPAYDALAALYAQASSTSREALFGDDTTWTEGNAAPPRGTEWKFVPVPVMWTWNSLSTAEPSLLNKLLSAGEKGDAAALDSIGSIGRDRKSVVIGKKPRIKVLAAGVKFSYGNARRGYDYGWWNTYDALGRFENVQLRFFDYVTEAQQKGVAGMSDRLLEIVREERPDVLFYGPFDLHADILHEAMSFITEHTETQTIAWMSDDHWRFENYSRKWAPLVNYIVTTSKEAVDKYSQLGFGQKVIKSQWAFNPFTYGPLRLARTRDVSFVGMAHGNRPEVIARMRKSGLNVDVFGFGWSEDMDIPFQDMVRIFSQTKINLNLSNASTITTQQIKGRNFEVPGCGGFLLTTPADNLEEYYEFDREVVVASSIEELMDKARYYLAHDFERETIAQRAYERTLAEHTWTHRFLDIFKRVGFSALARPLPPTGASPFLLPAPASATEDVGHDIATSIIVFAYNQLNYTKQCVESLLHYTAGPYELILVDNGSTDNTFAYFESVRKFHPNTRVLRNFQNRIVEANVNYAVSLARGKYIVNVTNDTLVHEGWLENFVRLMEAFPGIGMIGPRSNKISGPQLMQAEYDTLEAYQTFAAQRGREQQGRHFAVDRMVGMFTMHTKEAFVRIGGLDPDLPTNGRDGGYGFSDDDISLRLRLAGYTLQVADDVFIHHFGSVTASKYRPDLFGPAQNINKEKYLQKLLRNEHVRVGTQGELTLTPYGPGEPIPVAENTVIRSPRIVAAVADSSAAERLRNKGKGADTYSLDLVSPGQGALYPWLLEAMAIKEYDFVVLIDKQHSPDAGTVHALIDTALGFPDVAVMVPIGDYAPSTHALPAEKGKDVSPIPYADMSFCVLNMRLIRACLRGLALNTMDEEPFWFLQRRVRGGGYFIARAAAVNVRGNAVRARHPYDAYTLPEALLKDGKLAQALAVYQEDLRRDPTFVESLYQLARLARERNQRQEAIQYIQQALQQDPNHIQSYIFLSRLFLNHGELERAEPVVRLANLKQPGHPEVQDIVAEFERTKSTQNGVSTAGQHTMNAEKKPRTPGMTSLIIRVSQDLETTRKCFHTVKKHTHEPHEVIFIVHTSSPPAIKWAKKLAREHQNCIVLQNPEGLGFPKEINQGIQASSGEYILILDDSVLVTEGWLSGMLECLRTSPDTGIVGPMLDTISGPQSIGRTEFTSAGALDEFAHAFRARNRSRRVSIRKIAGLCMLFRHALTEQIGLFDESFRSTSFSDDDFSLRAVLDDRRNFIAGDVFVHYAAGDAYERDTFNGKKTIDDKWRGIDSATPEGKKLVVLSACETAAQWHHQNGLTDKAVAALVEAIKCAPEEKRIYLELAELLLDAKRFQDAFEAVASMPEEGRDDLRSHELMGYACEGLGRLDEAAGHAERMLALNPSYAPAQNLKGLLAHKKGDQAAAKGFFRKAAEADPGYGEPHTNLGVLAWAAGREEEALNFLEHGFTLSPAASDCATLYHKAVAALGQFSRAETALREAKAPYPHNKRIFFLLIDVLLRLEKYDVAMREVEQAILTFDRDDGIIAAAREIRNRVDALEAAKPAKKKSALSLCMIVKNEEAHLAKCLMSVRDLVDEMIIVDTGSIDKTRDIARAFGAKVYDFAWANDFAAARNVSLEKATCGWILVLDADEVISPLDHGALSDLVRRGRAKPAAYTIVTRNYTNLVSTQGWNANDGRYVREEAGTGWHPSAKVRLFPNDRRIRFRNPVHEVVEQSIMDAGMPIKPCAAPVHHYGKMNADKTISKGEEYYLLGKKKLGESGGDARAIQELAVQAGELQRYEEAVELWQRLIRINPHDAHAYFNLSYAYLKQKKYEETLTASARALELAPGMKEAVLNNANAELIIGSVRNAISSLEQVLRAVPEYPPAMGLLATAYYVDGRKDKALEMFARLRKLGFDCIDFLQEQAEMLVSTNRTAEAVRILEAALESRNVHENTRQLLAKCLTTTASADLANTGAA